ncbi:hypothetical protein BB558_001690 [Smittium angustum]|uniref:Uncharacterized protein n=1 Tax=Smittium angustum TaxID=133377 RepID=A0A2U1JB36_SMIAN|nr:hypothetical protein BB558_001690 [Smittium angustum]
MDVPQALLTYVEQNGVKLVGRGAGRILKNPLLNPGLSQMVSGSRLPGNRAGIGQEHDTRTSKSKRGKGGGAKKGTSSGVFERPMSFTKAKSEEGGNKGLSTTDDNRNQKI